MSKSWRRTRWNEANSAFHRDERDQHRQKQERADEGEGQQEPYRYQISSIDCEVQSLTSASHHQDDKRDPILVKR